MSDRVAKILIDARTRATRAERDASGAWAAMKTQEKLIERLRVGGQPTQAAEGLLLQLKEMHVWRMSERDRTAAELQELKVTPAGRLNSHG